LKSQKLKVKEFGKRTKNAQAGLGVTPRRGFAEQRREEGRGEDGVMRGWVFG
jgi:hypothetical protein